MLSIETAQTINDVADIFLCEATARKSFGAGLRFTFLIMITQETVIIRRFKMIL